MAIPIVPVSTQCLANQNAANLSTKVVDHCIQDLHHWRESIWTAHNQCIRKLLLGKTYYRVNISVQEDLYIHHTRYRLQTLPPLTRIIKTNKDRVVRTFMAQNRIEIFTEKYQEEMSTDTAVEWKSKTPATILIIHILVIVVVVRRYQLLIWLEKTVIRMSVFHRTLPITIINHHRIHSISNMIWGILLLTFLDRYYWNLWQN